MSAKRARKDEPIPAEFLMADQMPLKGYWSGPGFVNEQVEYVVIDGMAIAEGDIALGTAEELKKSSDPAVLLDKEKREDDRKAAAMAEMPAGVLSAGGLPEQSQYYWPNCTIPYDIDPNMANPSRVTDAMQHWTEKTGFKFVQRTTQNDYVHFFGGNGCWSYVGKQGGKQDLSLGAGCDKGNAIHEIGHAIGFFHEQSRNDRNTYVKINWQNIIPNKTSNFAQYLNSGRDIGSYDYCSIMHYPKWAFSVNNQDTITPLKPVVGCVLGQRDGLSPGDIAAMKVMYPGCYPPPDRCLAYKLAALRCLRAGNRLCYLLNIIRYYICRWRLTRDLRYLQLYRKYRTLYMSEARGPIELLEPTAREAVEEPIEPESEEEIEEPFEEELEPELEEIMEPEFGEETEPLEEPEQFALPGTAACTVYRIRAAYYLRLYRLTRMRRYLCYYYRFLANYYCCLYRYTRNPTHRNLCSLYTARYRQCM